MEQVITKTVPIVTFRRLIEMSLGDIYQHLPKLGIEIKVKKRVGWLEFRYLNKELVKGQSSLLRTRIAEVEQQLRRYQGVVAKGVDHRSISRTNELMLPEVHLRWRVHYSMGHGRLGRRAVRWDS